MALMTVAMTLVGLFCVCRGCVLWVSHGNFWAPFSNEDEGGVVGNSPSGPAVVDLP
jgi:hypothetical protein